MAPRVSNRGTRNKPPELSKIVAVPVLIETGFRIESSACVGVRIGETVFLVRFPEKLLLDSAPRLEPCDLLF